MKDISTLLDIIDKDEAKQVFIKTFLPKEENTISPIALEEMIDGSFNLFWEDNFQSEVVDKTKFTAAIKKEILACNPKPGLSPAISYSALNELNSKKANP